MKIIDTAHDIRQYVSEHLARFDMSQYPKGFNALVEDITLDLLDLMFGTGFKYGDPMPEISQRAWEELIKRH